MTAILIIAIHTLFLIAANISFRVRYKAIETQKHFPRANTHESKKHSVKSKYGGLMCITKTKSLGSHTIICKSY